MMSASVPERELFDMTSVRNLQQSGSPPDIGTSQFNPAVFWSINALWITLLIGIAVWMWKFRGAERLSNWSQSFIAQESGEQGNEETQQQAIPPEKRRKLLSDYFRTSRVHMVVGENDVLMNNKKSHTAPMDSVNVDTGATNEDAGDVDVEAGVAARISETTSQDSAMDLDPMECSVRSTSTIDPGFLVLHTQQGDRLVPNCCAVCLASYEKGDDVVWSKNENCSHAFHEGCVTDWLTGPKMQVSNPCPCCRCIFVNTEEVRPHKQQPLGPFRAMIYDYGREVPVDIVQSS